MHLLTHTHTYQFTVHMPLGDLIITLPLLEEHTHVPIHPQHSDPLPLIDYVTLMGLAALSRTVGLRPALPLGTYTALDAGSNVTF